MKILILNLALLFSTGPLFAQITVTNATFPAAGDTLKTAVDFTPGGISISPPGGPYTWDFSSLGLDFSQTTVFKVASEGAAFANFAGADLVTIGEAGAETYYNVEATSFNNLGFSGMAPAGGFPIQTEFKFNPPVPERRAPLNFIDNFLAESSVNVAFPLDAIPGNILDSLGIPTALVDSLRVKANALRNEVVDAYGTLAIPGGTYDVLRQKRTEYRDTRIEIHTFLGWFDVTDQVGPAAGFGKDTITSYLFINDVEKEYIAVVTTDESGLSPQQVTFKDNGVLSSTKDLSTAGPQVWLAPNPVDDIAWFDFKNWKSGNYDLFIFDTQGRIVAYKKMDIAGGHREQVPTWPLAPGSYFYQIKQTNGGLTFYGRFIKQG